MSPPIFILNTFLNAQHNRGADTKKYLMSFRSFYTVLLTYTLLHYWYRLIKAVLINATIYNLILQKHYIFALDFFILVGAMACHKCQRLMNAILMKTSIPF